MNDFMILKTLYHCAVSVIYGKEFLILHQEKTMRYFWFLLTAVVLIFPMRADANSQSVINYYFTHDGGVFVHSGDDDISAFRYREIPIEKPYSGTAHFIDMTRDGTIVAVLRGDFDNPNRSDLVKFDRNNQMTPLFGVITREELDNDMRIDRQFGGVSIDHAKGNIVFTVHEMISRRGTTQDASYLSKIYRLPVIGGICENLGQVDNLIMDITAENGRVYGLLQIDRGKRRSNRVYFMDENQEWSLMETRYEIEEIDSAPSSDRILMKIHNHQSDSSGKLIETRADQIGSTEYTVIKEYTDSSSTGAFRYSLDGSGILYKQTHQSPWGDSRINFILSESGITPLVRADLALTYSPIKAKKIDASSIDIKTARLLSSNQTEHIGNFHICAHDGTGSMLYAIHDNSDKSIILLDSELNDKMKYPSDKSKHHGIYLKDDRIHTITSLDLGEQLISFESIPYGEIDIIDADGGVENHNIHLAWNIGGRMLGITIPEKNMFIGSDRENIHLTLRYPFRGAFPTSDYITPVYLMSLDEWMIEHPAFLGRINEMTQYIVRSFEDKSGNLYMLDSLGSEIIRLDSSRKKITKLGWLPDLYPPLAHPTDMALIDGVLNVLDPVNSRIVRFTTDSTPIEIIHLDADAVDIDNTRFLEIDIDAIAILHQSGDRKFVFSLN